MLFLCAFSMLGRSDDDSREGAKLSGHYAAAFMGTGIDSISLAGYNGALVCAIGAEQRE